jgi:hypothetical protein
MSLEDLSSLLGAMIPFAQKLLTEGGSFPPFAGSVDAEGSVHGFSAKPEAAEMPAEEIVELLVASLRESVQRGECRAAAICSDVRVAREAGGEKFNAIAISLESTDGTSMECYMPYKKSEAGTYDYQDLFGGIIPLRIFDPVK